MEGERISWGTKLCCEASFPPPQHTQQALGWGQPSRGETLPAGGLAGPHNGIRGTGKAAAHFKGILSEKVRCQGKGCSAVGVGGQGLQRPRVKRGVWRKERHPEGRKFP